MTAVVTVLIAQFEDNFDDALGVKFLARPTGWTHTEIRPAGASGQGRTYEDEEAQ